MTPFDRLYMISY